MKRITFLKFLFLLCALVVGTSSAWAEDYEKYSGSITEGDYLIVYSNVAMKATISNDRFGYTTVTPSNDIVLNPTADIVWHIAASGDYWTIYNAGVSKYAASTGAKNKGQLLPSGTDDMSLWTVTGSSTYEFVNKKNGTNNVNKNLRYNSGYGFACYSTSTGGALTLYKKKAATATALAVKTAPKVNYKIGEKLDLTELVLDATVGGNHVDVTSDYTATISGTAVTSGITVLNTVGEQTITFTYGGQTATQTLHVGALQNIALTTTGVKTVYNEGQTFDPTNLVVKATFSDEETSATEWEETIDAADYTYSPDRALTTADNEVTISYTWGEVDKTANIDITVSAATAYTVTFNAGTGFCATASLTEETGLAGVTLPTATIGVTGWSFAGWAETATANTEVAPALYAAESTYHPVDNVSLYAVYSYTETSSIVFTRATTVEAVTGASKVVIIDGRNSKLLNSALTTVTGPTEIDGKITNIAENAIFILAGNNTDGFTLTNSGKTLGIDEENAEAKMSNTDNLWKFELSEASGYSGCLVLTNKTLTNATLEYNNSNTVKKWTTPVSSNYLSNNYFVLKIYIPATTVVYNSNPAEMVNPTIAFTAVGDKTLYLKNTNTYDNAANVTGISKTPTYTSSDATVASVNEAGVVTALKKGTTTIMAKVDAEIGVNIEASTSYEVTVKDASNVAGLKAITSSSSVLAFTADLTDAVVTYVDGDNAYIQDASGAVYASCGSSLTAGKKINGAVSGSIKASYQIDEITAINLDNATVTEDGDIPVAVVKTLAEIKAAGTEYDAKLVRVNGSKVTTALTDTSNGDITDDAGTTSFKLVCPYTGINVDKDAEGSFTGFISIYNGSTYRLNIYEESQISITKNAPTNQTLTFAENAIVIDEETDGIAAFTGQTVSGAHTTLTYSITADENSVIKSLDASTGAIELNEKVGSATIKVDAAAEDVVDGGITTPYKAASAEYTITINPRYTSTFSVNGVVTVARQTTHGAEITVPTLGNVGYYNFIGWKANSAIDTPTDEVPEMVTPPTTPTSNVTYYAVFAQERAGGEEEVTSTLNMKQSEPANSTSTVNGVTWSWYNLTFATSGNSVGMKGGENATVTIDLPENAIKAKQLSLVRSQDWGSATVVLSNSNGEIGSIGQTGNTYINFTNENNTSSQYSLSQSTSKNAWISSFTLSYTVLGTENFDYRTSLPIVEITIPASGYLSYCSPYKLDFSETNVKAYKAGVNAGTVTLTKVDVVPAEEGVVLFSSEIANSAVPEATDYIIPVTEKDVSDVSGNEMVGVLARTQVEWNPSDGVYNYILQQGEFRKATTPGGYLKANRAYLSTGFDITANGNNEARPLTIVFEGETTGINGVEEIAPVTKTRKVVKNGRLVIETPNGEFTIDGAKVK